MLLFPGVFVTLHPKNTVYTDVRIKEVVCALEKFAPLPLQADYDNAGVQIGLTEAEVSGALLCLDVTEDVVDEAVAKGCNLIVSHHPLIFRRLGSITGADYVGRTVARAIKSDVAVVAMHTNLDSAVGGVNFKMAAKMGLRDVAMIGGRRQADGVEGGEAVIGSLPGEMRAVDFLAMLKTVFAADCVQANGLLRRPVRRVALCGGAGGFMLGEAIRCGADAFVTGEMGYHQYFGHGQEVQIAVIGHYQSERHTPELLGEIIGRECPGVRCVVAETDTNPIVYL